MHIEEHNRQLREYTILNTAQSISSLKEVWTVEIAQPPPDWIWTNDLNTAWQASWLSSKCKWIDNNQTVIVL